MEKIELNRILPTTHVINIRCISEMKWEEYKKQKFKKLLLSILIYLSYITFHNK